MRIVAISGANRGLGLALCRALVARGDRVLAGCRTPSRAGELTRLAVAHPGRLHILPLDLMKPPAIHEFAREVAMIAERLDVLINNGGVLPAGERFGQVQQRHMLEAFTTNVAGSLLLTQELTPRLELGQRARVMNVSSELGSIAKRDAFRNPSYSISKAGLNMATRLLAFELAPRGIICFAVHPGWMRTDMGGSNAPLAPADVATALVSLLDGIGPNDAGRLLDRNGTAMPW